ncbi:phage/plasmid primase, P4 family [Clostridium perfringens]|uniref:DNA primase family protein n=1 Tax=Clostridium perfringens TaxID=1502 RepID=UPI002624CD9E|nr:phage/plasmid primase, P4 family [Clostridium perfringens]MDN4557007.1 phage/plasmid primase, P4 family [Clostridium perfringens]MDT7987036.1 phage/plasmid primase, P4 family [Clostridium perfringens]WVM61647.1 phage/plasmid primase, P4 family [Clostridium perfringens]
MNKEEFGKWDLREARRFLECFCKVECSEGTSYSGKSTELKGFDGKSSELKEYDGTSCDSKGNELKGSENSCGRINIRIFSDKKGTGFKGKNLSFNMKDFQSKSKILMAHNEANRGIFFVVNSGGNSDRKINKINAQFFECDTLSLEEQLENISKFPLEPSIIVQTKKSLHVYFLIKNGKVEKFRDIQKKLAKHFNGDGSCINESRVMRVPGFYHCKEDPLRVKCIKFNPNLFYTQEDLEKELSYSESKFIVNDDNYIRKEETNKAENNLSRENLKRLDNTRNSNKENLKWLEPTRSLNEENLGESECTSNLLSEISDIGIENNGENLESYISNYNSNLQESTLLSKENISENYRKSISEKKSEGRNNKSKEQVLYESEENLHIRSEDNISKNNQLNIKNTVDEEVKSENGLEVVCFKCDFIKHCKKNSKTLSEPLWHGMITNLALFKGGTYRIHELSKGYKTYSEKETEEKISNFLKSGAGPMTCETLRDRGYTCPRYGKTCYGKSPASLAFKPLTVKDIRECIKTLKVSEVSNATNVDTALRFIENYMYNIGVALGKSLIEEDLANHLKIKNSKDLISFYREVVRNFKKERGNKAKSKNKSKPKNSGNLPWYEEQEKGLKFLPFVLAKHLSETRDVYYGGESFLIYENGVYNISGEKEAGRIIMDYMLPNYCIMASIRDCRDQWDILVSKDFDDFNRNPYLVNVRNGLLDIRDMSFKEHTPSYLSTVQLNVEYNPQVDCPQFKKFLNEVLDCKLIPLVQEIVGYLLTTNTASQKAFVFWGPARTGKSTLLWVVEYLLLGKKNVSNIPWQEIGDKFKTAELLGKLANVFSDLPSKSIDDTGIFKVVTGEDYLMAEKKNKNPFKFKPFARLVFSCNELPRNYVDRTEGFYRRLIIVPFNRQIEKNKIDKALKYKFQREKEGIFNWALEGLKRLYENNFEFSENELTDGVKKEYKRENNNVISFVEECCELDGLFSCSRIEIYEAYKEFCVEAGLKALSQIKFNKELEGNFNITRSRSGKLRSWNGVRIKLEDLIIR